MGNRVFSVVRVTGTSIRVQADVETVSASAGVRWGTHSVVAVLDGDPADLLMRAGRSQPGGVDMRWFEAVA